MKTCRKCRKEYPATLEYFHYDSKVKSGLRARCKKCILLGNKETRDPEKARLALNAWRKANPDKYKAQWDRSNTKKAESGYQSRYYNDNKDKINLRRNEWLTRTGKGLEYVHKRRALYGSDVVTADDWDLVLSAYGITCLYPGCQDKKLVRDHVVPISKGGRNHISNMQPLCRHHNAVKHVDDTDYRHDLGAQFQ